MSDARIYRMRLVGDDAGTGRLEFDPLTRWEALVWNVRSILGLGNPSGIVRRPEMSALLSCPACSSEIVAVGLLTDPTMVNGHQACCGSCGTCGPERPNEREATKAWNAMPRRDRQ